MTNKNKIYLSEDIKSKQNTIEVGEKLISVRGSREFAILERQPNESGLMCITFSIPLTSRDADIIDQSGIAEVKQFTTSGTLVFARKSFYEPYKMTDLITDILTKYETKKEAHLHLA